MAEPKKKKDIVTPIAVTVGSAALVTGLYFYMKKPKGVDPGDTIMAMFVFDYAGEGGDYILQVSLGHIRIMEPFFDHVEGLTWELEIKLPVPEEPPQKWEFGLLCPLPAATSSGTYDAEALIRTPGMDWLDYLKGTKMVTKNAVKVRELE